MTELRAAATVGHRVLPADGLHDDGPRIDESESAATNPCAASSASTVNSVRPSHDLDNRTAIHDAVVAFYRGIVFDDVLAPVFNEVAEVDWAEHIPRLIDYWCRVLLGEAGYQGALLNAHQHVHDIEPLRPEHFDRWLLLWTTTLDEGWNGPKTDAAKAHAFRIGAVLHRRLLGAELRSPVGSTSNTVEVPCVK